MANFARQPPTNDSVSKNRQNKSASTRRGAAVARKPGLNPKQFPVLFLIALVVVVAWYRLRPAEPAPAKPTVVNRAAPATFNPAETPATEPPPPVVPPPKPEPAPTPAADPLADLQTAVPYTLQQFQAGNYLALMPPDQVAQMSDQDKAGVVAMFQNPQTMQRFNALAAALQSVQGMPPTYDATGNIATYTLPPGSPAPTVVFRKINGQWFGMDPGGQ
jgi:hypothetical protein